MGFIKRSWKGEEKLWKVFWIYGLVFGIILGIVMSVAGASMGDAGIALLVVWLVYYVWLAVSQWRCAFNADWKIWGYVVRILLVLGIFGFIASLAMGGLMVGSYRLAEAECRKELKAYIEQGGQDPQGFNNDCYARRVNEQDKPQTEPLAQQPSAPPQTEPAAQQPVAAPQAATGQEDQYRAQCIQTMRDHALKNNADADAYIAQNQDYIESCVKHYMSQGSGTVKP